MPAPTLETIYAIHLDRLRVIYELEQADYADSFDIYRETLRRVWVLCPSNHNGDRALRAWWRTFARNAHLARREDALNRADGRHLAANKHKARMIALTRMPAGGSLLDILEG